MKIVHEGRANVFRRVKDIEGEVDVNEGFYTFYQRSPQRYWTSLIADGIGNKNCRVEMEPKMRRHGIWLESNDPWETRGARPGL
jgi:hypothetical protein